MQYGIDIFSGAGGLSLGAEMAGIRIKTAIEINKSAAQTFLRNHKGADVLQDDIQDIDPKKLHSDKKPIFVIMGGPPCQGFSMSNTRTRNMKNEKNFLFLEVVRFVQEIRPRFFLCSFLVFRFSGFGNCSFPSRLVTQGTSNKFFKC